MQAQSPIGVLGAGSWGTALAIQLARSGRKTYLWGRDAAQITALKENRQNKKYLPGAVFPDALSPVADLNAVLADAHDLLVVAPSHAFRDVLEKLSAWKHADRRLAWATKGLEEGSNKFPHEIAEEILGKGLPLAVLSGPTFAKEVGADLPTAITIAGERQFAQDLANTLHNNTFRPYTSDDVIGVEIGGAVKNVIAIGAGISDGLALGANSRVALITRGLAEMMRLGIALGGKQETFMGLAGMGDLVLTCTDDQSRNRRMGLLLAEGKSPREAQDIIEQVVEGVRVARAVRDIARQNKVEMPIVDQVCRVLYDSVPPGEAVGALLDRRLKEENH
ncbi:MAG: NAD(P)-dependent glycerol-3-phosphate dehydrogenase [Gammaproteobacteria bacterium]|nr:NAD(P)-dependent glycerol-3-phosphate dehydrogenase [Gammaproteobacteria bacterium]